jgi:hypothetical protein
MRRILFLLVFVSMPQTHADMNTELKMPNHFETKANWSAPSYRIHDKGTKIADIFSYAPTSLSTYEMYDAYGAFIMSADLRQSTDPIRLKFYHGQTLLGFIDETSSTNKYSSFYIYAEDGKTRLIKGEFNYWRTKITLFSAINRDLFAEMLTSYSCKWCDWTFDMINRDLYDEIPISPQVMLFSIGLQGENWRTDDKCPNNNNNNNNNNNHNHNHNHNYDLSLPSHILSNNTSIKPSETLIQKVIAELDAGFEKESHDMTFKNHSEKAAAYEKYCQDLVTSPNTPKEKKEAILYLYSTLNPNIPYNT